MTEEPRVPLPKPARPAIGERLPDEGAARAVERRGGYLAKAGIALCAVSFALLCSESTFPGWAAASTGVGFVLGCALTVTGLVIELVGGFARFRIERRAKQAPSESPQQEARPEDE